MAEGELQSDKQEILQDGEAVEGSPGSESHTLKFFKAAIGRAFVETAQTSGAPEEKLQLFYRLAERERGKLGRAISKDGHSVGEIESLLDELLVQGVREAIQRHGGIVATVLERDTAPGSNLDAAVQRPLDEALKRAFEAFPSGYSPELGRERSR